MSTYTATKSGRVRHVVDALQVAHLWANKVQYEARVPGGNFHFYGDRIYSYGSHFEIARHVERKGKSCVFFTTLGYSNTTAKHISITRQACRHLTVFTFGCRFDASHKDIFEWYRGASDGALELAIKSRKGSNKRAEAFAQAARYVEEGNAFAAFFGLRARLKLKSEAEAAEAIQQAADQAKGKALRAAAKARQLLKENLAAWLAGEDCYVPYHENTYFRFIADGDEVQTSHGARFHTKDGKRAYSILRALRAKGRTFQTNGTKIPVGPWQVDSLDADGNVKAGCHFIKWREIEAFAVKAGWNTVKVQPLPAEFSEHA